jgi:hypothetical protein
MLALAAAMTLAVSPARTVLRAPATRAIEVSNLGSDDVAVDVSWKPLGRRVVAAGWLSISPGRLVLRRGAHGFITVRAGSGGGPGDHDLLVLVTGHAATRAGVAVQLRAGVRVRVRASGRLVHRLRVEGIRVRRAGRTRALLVSVGNRGNVTEQLRGRLRVALLERGRVISRLRSTHFHELYPATRGVLVLPYAGRARGRVTAVVRLGRLERRYRLLL